MRLPNLTEGSVYELLRRDPRVRFDPYIAHAGLIYDDTAREILAGVHSSYMRIAPMIAFADTWRASGERIAVSRFRGRDVNGDNVSFLRSVAAAHEGIVVGALTGPRGDAYRPAEAPSFDEAMRYHEAQIAALAAASVEMIVAATLPAFEEAKAIAVLLAGSGMPWMLSFVVRPEGKLLDGTTLDDAIRAIDARSAPAGYSINCVHPDVAREALSHVSPATRGRIIAFQGNTSARRPEELDGLEFLDSGEPGPFAAAVGRLMHDSSVRIVGGCCGTDPRHIAQLAQFQRPD